ncbi:RNA polymerase sigma factor SigJ [Streptomyces sp. GMY02]|uniref:RNA polymerase sigma factor SigJ n=1 Tax=Streptomyces sp. GMY02 TaxID=1333528 RepID=UPI001C2BE81A|nr:RNA polymerase sigma factor SigJ [Streptomyces sp. GMY02]QXE36700.1 RNA polymerase sigma factor SigJ [Streptomyces sp. GMY02]
MSGTGTGAPRGSAEGAEASRSDAGEASEAADAAGAAGAADAATQVFLDHRELLFSLVYNMLGSVADTEDVLQDTWLAWAARNREQSGAPITHQRAYLVRIAVNGALARRASVSRRREEYVGPWLPEPLLTAPGTVPLTAGASGAPGGPGGDDTGDASGAVVRAEAVSIALLVVLETLTPLERAVFVLHEVFGYPHTEIAGILDRAPAAVRQLAHRAREHVQSRRPRHRTEPRVRREATERFLAAALGGDLDALLRVLAPDVTMWTDGGGRVRQTVQRPLHGRDKVARMIAGVAGRTPENLDVRYRTVNGDPTAVLFADDEPFAVMVIGLAPEGDQVTEIYTVTNPDKLKHID